MNMSTQLKEKINISVDSIETLTDVDLADLCNITEQAIKAGGGFGWLRVPTRDILIDYWTKRTNDKYIKLIVGRLNGVIAGTLQLAYEAPNIESRKNIKAYLNELNELKLKYSDLKSLCLDEIKT